MRPWCAAPRSTRSPPTHRSESQAARQASSPTPPRCTPSMLPARMHSPTPSTIRLLHTPLPAVHRTSGARGLALLLLLRRPTPLAIHSCHPPPSRLPKHCLKAAIWIPPLFLEDTWFLFARAGQDADEGNACRPLREESTIGGSAATRTCTPEGETISFSTGVRDRWSTFPLDPRRICATGLTMAMKRGLGSYGPLFLVRGPGCPLHPPPRHIRIFRLLSYRPHPFCLTTLPTFGRAHPHRTRRNRRMGSSGSGALCPC